MTSSKALLTDEPLIGGHCDWKRDAQKSQFLTTQSEFLSVSQRLKHSSSGLQKAV